MPPPKSERVELHACRIRDTFKVSRAERQRRPAQDAGCTRRSRFTEAKEARKCSAMLPPLS